MHLWMLQGRSTRQGKTWRLAGLEHECRTSRLTSRCSSRWVAIRRWLVGKASMRCMVLLFDDSNVAGFSVCPRRIRRPVYVRLRLLCQHEARSICHICRATMSIAEMLPSSLTAHLELRIDTLFHRVIAFSPRQSSACRVANYLHALSAATSSFEDAHRSSRYNKVCVLQIAQTLRVAER